MVYRVGVGHLSRFLQEVDIFQTLSDRQLDRVAALCEGRAFRAEDCLAIQDAQGSHLYVIRKGEIIVSTGAEGKDLVVRKIREHETVPVAVLFEPPVLVTTARAATDGEALAIPRVRLMELCELEPQIGMRIYRAVCGVLMNRYRYVLHKLSERANAEVYIGPPWEGGAEV